MVALMVIGTAMVILVALAGTARQQKCNCGSGKTIEDCDCRNKPNV